MKREAIDDDDEMAVEEERPAIKRARAVAQDDSKHHRTFEERHAQLAFKEAYHPERLSVHILAQRERALEALPSFLADLKAGSLVGPRIKGAGLLRDLPGASSAAADPPASPPRGPPPHPFHLIKFEPLPSAVAAQARAALLAAAAGPMRDGAEPCGFVSLLTAEPIGERTRLWAAFDDRDQADKGMQALTALPQLAELADPPPAKSDVLMPSREAVPPPLTDEDISRHRERSDDLIEAIETRLGLAKQVQALRGGDMPELTAREELELRILYLRRVLHYDYFGGGQFASHASLLQSCGEAHLPNKLMVHACLDSSACIHVALLTEPACMHPALCGLPAWRPCHASAWQRSSSMHMHMHMAEVQLQHTPALAPPQPPADVATSSPPRLHRRSTRRLATPWVPP